MRQYTPGQLDEARAQRRAKMQHARWVFETCECAFPVVTYRNSSGHDEDCPVHVAWVEAKVS